MKLYTEIADLDEYEVCGEAARETFDKIINADRGRAFIMALEEIYPEGMTDTELNDLLWFDEDYCLELAGVEPEEEEEEEEDEE